MQKRMLLFAALVFVITFAGSAWIVWMNNTAHEPILGPVDSFLPEATREQPVIVGGGRIILEPGETRIVSVSLYGLANASEPTLILGNCRGSDGSFELLGTARIDDLIEGQVQRANVTVTAPMQNGSYACIAAANDASGEPTTRASFILEIEQ